MDEKRAVKDAAVGDGIVAPRPTPPGTTLAARLHHTRHVAHNDPYMGVKIYSDRAIVYRDSSSFKHSIKTWRVVVWFKSRQYSYRLDTEGNRFTDFRRADLFRAKLVADLSNDRFEPEKYTRAKKWTFTQLAEAWVNDFPRRVKNLEIGPEQAKKATTAFKELFIPILGNLEAEDVRPYDIDKVLRHIEAVHPHWGKKTKLNHLSMLQAFLNHLRTKEVITRKFSMLDLGTIPQPERNWLGVDMQNKILSCIGEDYRPIFHLMSRMGLRPGEARALQVQDVDWNRDTLKVQRAYRDSGNELKPYPKSGRGRSIPIHPELMPALKEITHAKIGTETPLFLNPATGHPYTHTALSGHWREACKKAEIKIQLYEGTRHSVASQMHNAGVSDLIIKSLLGHTKLDTTAKYAHASMDSFKRAFAQVVEIGNHAQTMRTGEK